MKLLALLMIGAVPLAQAQTGASCKVIDPELQGYFSGKCDGDGMAEGLGLARGAAEYVGEFKAGRKHGRGVKNWPNGDRYVGDFANDHREGYGIYAWGPKSPFAGERYTGQYVADRRHGHGVYEWPTGDRYEGGWVADRVTGYATPMQVLQIKYRQAVTAAVAKVGVKVCRDEEVGISGRRQISGTVEQVGADGRVAVRGANGETGGAGELLWEDPVRWLPCY